MKPKLRDLKVEPEQAFDNLRTLARKVLSVPKSAIKVRARGKHAGKQR
ncbi:MAG: hypothetical protein WAL68_15610 [Candidatus Binatus sp.]|jgi:hypothetical protein